MCTDHIDQRMIHSGTSTNSLAAIQLPTAPSHLPDYPHQSPPARLDCYPSPNKGCTSAFLCFPWLRSCSLLFGSPGTLFKQVHAKHQTYSTAAHLWRTFPGCHLGSAGETHHQGSFKANLQELSVHRAFPELRPCLMASLDAQAWLILLSLNLNMARVPWLD